MLTAGLGTGIALANGSDDSDTTTRQTTGPGNSWQIVKCASDADCQTNDVTDGQNNATGEADTEYVRLRKWVEQTGVENRFTVHLQIDKRADSVIEALNGDLYYDNSNNLPVGGYGTLNGQVTGTLEPAYFLLRIFDQYNNVVGEQLRSIADTKGGIKNLALFPKGSNPTVDNGLFIWRRGDSSNKASHDPNNPTVVNIYMSWDGFGEVFGTTRVSVDLSPESLPEGVSASVTDVMGEYIRYEEGSAKDLNAEESGSVISFSGSTLSWTPQEKSDVTAGDDGWLNNVAELQYTVELDVTGQGFVSGGLPETHKTPDDNARYVVNDRAKLHYTVTTTKTTGSTGTSDPKPGTADFPQPIVRGLLYDIVATKTDGSNMLDGATFGLYDADGDTAVGKDGSEVTEDNPQYTVTSGQDGMSSGQIVFTGLPWGTYTVKEISAPEGYDPTDEQWTVTVCYTNNPSNLEDSTVDENLDTGNHAMVTKAGSFVNKKSTVSATIKVAKSLGGRTGEQGSEFTFTLTPKDAGTPMPVDESGNRMESMTVTIDMNGKREGEALFTGLSIPAGKVGDYTYTVTEDKGSVLGVVYSKAVYTVTVHADKQGNLTYTYTRTTDDAGNEGEPQTKDTALFVNGPTEFAGTQTLTKYLVGRNWQEGDAFTFRIEYTGSDPVNSTPVPVPESPNGTVRSVEANTWDVTLNYDPGYCFPEKNGIPSYCDLFLGFKTVYPTDESHHLFYYKVTELSGDTPGMLYSKAEYKLEADVFRNHGFNEAGFGIYMRPTQVRDDEGNSLESSGPSTRAAIAEMRFINTFSSVSALPLTGGGSTARSLLLAGGGVLLVAGAAWLLARRRRA